jgi:phosphopantetheinyl transferase
MPQIESVSLANGTICFWKLEEPLADLLSLHKIVFPTRNLPTITHPQRLAQTIAAQLLIKNLFIENEINWEYPKGIKPRYFVDGLEVFMNISHAGNLAAVYKANSVCGLDLEKIDTKAARLKSKFCSEKELLWSQNFEDLDAYFTFIWSVKESIYKLKGIKGIEFKSQIQLTHAPNFNSNSQKVLFSSDQKSQEFEVRFFQFEQTFICYVTS